MKPLAMNMDGPVLNWTILKTGIMQGYMSLCGISWVQDFFSYKIEGSWVLNWTILKTGIMQGYMSLCGISWVQDFFSYKIEGSWDVVGTSTWGYDHTCAWV